MNTNTKLVTLATLALTLGSDMTLPGRYSLLGGSNKCRGRIGSTYRKPHERMFKKRRKGK